MVFVAQVIFIFTSMTWSLHSYAQEPTLLIQTKSFSGPIVTDRPSFSVGTGIVPKGYIQFETGYTFSFDSAKPTTTTHTFPDTLIRIGLNDQFEIRLEWPNQSFIKREKKVSGLRDLAIGFKTHVFQQQGWKPQLSIGGRLSIPTGNKHLSSNHVNPELLTILSYTLNKRFSLFGNINIGGTGFKGRHFAQFSTSLGLSKNFKQNLSGYIEYFSVHPVRRNSHSIHFMQTGIIHQLTPQLQVDARIGAGLNQRAEDMFVGMGISWRL